MFLTIYKPRVDVHGIKFVPEFDPGSGKSLDFFAELRVPCVLLGV